MNLPGRIYARQLPPIAFDPSKNQTRESISLQLRVQMLEAIKSSPEDAGTAISWSFRVKNILSIGALALLQYWIYQIPCKFVMETFHINFRRLSLYLFGLSLLVTVILYLFKIHIPKRTKPAPRSPIKRPASVPDLATLVKRKTRKTD